MTTPHDDNDRPLWSEPDEPASFLAAHNIQQQLLEKLSQPSGPSAAEMADLLGQWPAETNKEPDVAGAMFEDFRNRSLRGEPISRAKHDQETPLHGDSLASLFRRQDFLRSARSISQPSAPMFALPKVGDELFGYRLRSQLGQGAFARVFLAEQSELADRLVALKTSDLTGSEPQTLAQLQHTNIVPIYSVHEDTTSGIRAVCMPYFGGASLSQVLREIWKKNTPPTSGEEFVAALSEFSPQRGSNMSAQGNALGEQFPETPEALKGRHSGSLSDQVSPLQGFESPASPTQGDALGCHIAAPLGRNRKTASSKPTDHSLVDSGSRRDGLAQFTHRDFAQASAWIVARLAEGLQHAHDRGVLHRDIKPSNILLGGDGTPMLLDFNLSHDENQSNGQVEATLGGTVAYMAPEHLRALNIRSPEMIAQVDERSDIYGLGMVLFEMITGHNPFENAASYSPMPILVEAMAAERCRSIPSLRQFCPDVPWGLESILRKCLQPDATLRYQRADELAADLDCFLDDRSLRFAPELSRVEQVQKWTRRHPKFVSSATVALAATLFLTLGWLALSGTQARLSAAQARVVETEGSEARELAQRFERGTLKALCLVNTHSEMREHSEEGRQVCEETLALFGILDDPQWQSRSTWQRLTAIEQRKLAEDARELLLLLAGQTVDRTNVAVSLREANQPGQTLNSTNPHSSSTASRSETATFARPTSPSALELLDRAEAMRDLPPSAAVWRAKAALLRQLGQADQANAADQKANDIPPTTARDFYLLATTHLRSGSPDRHTRAIADLRQALKLDPRHYWSWMQKGLCHLEQEEPQLALADFGVCIGLWPEFAWGYFNRAVTLDQLGQKQAAVADYSAALERDSDLLAAVQNRGMAQLELQDNAAALADFDRVRNSGRSDPVLHALRGQALERLQRSDEADAAFALALTDEHLDRLAEPRRNQLLCSFGFAVCSRRPADAEQAFARVPSDDPKFSEALYGRGLLAVQAGRLEQAVELFGKALEVRPNFGEPRRFRAIMLARLGRFTEAITEINTALQSAPKSGATLYAAACVTALAAEQAPNPTAAQQATGESIRLLKQAIAQGHGQNAANDDDLKAIQQLPEFQRLLLK